MPISANERVGAIIAAAGSSRRAGQDKLFATVMGKPLLAWTLETFVHYSGLQRIVVVLRRETMEAGEALLASMHVDGLVVTCVGGERRQDSVRAGLERLEDCEWVLVHDGARPCVTPELIGQGIEAAKRAGAAIPAIQVTETVKEVGESNLIERTLPRSRLWTAQTPQIFRRELLVQAHEEFSEETVTDDAELLERMGHAVWVFPGDPSNLKVTTAGDLVLAEALLQARARRGNDELLNV
jgi:2-C-methyl-D-erythritol 4-phosphate cytidylyltransferase